MDDPRVRALSDAFIRTLNTNPAVIRQAEASLEAAKSQPEYAISVLKVVALDSPIEIRQAASVHFKNHVKQHWVPDADRPGQAVPPIEKEQIKALLPDLMLSTPPIVRAQLSEALAVISASDFPAQWPGLLPDLIERLRVGPPATVLGVLETANSIYKRYRSQFMTPALSQELEYSQCLVVPLLEALKRLNGELEAAKADEKALRVLLASVHKICRIFFSLNSPGLTEEFERTLTEWMGLLHAFLVLETDLLVEHDPDAESLPDAVKTAVCQAINLFMEINEEEFAKFLPIFVQAVWTQLVKVSLRPGQDNLAMSAVRFLTTVARSVHHSLFQGKNVLKEVCERIVIPNLQLREEDEEMFELNWVEYVRRDAEGSDSDTRRRAATDLVKALTEKFQPEVTALFSEYVAAMLGEAARDAVAGWKAKDCAVYLVSALAVRGRTAAAGATAVNALVPIPDFYNQQIEPELAGAGVDERPILKADALKFLTTFRGQVPKPVAAAAFPRLVALLGARANVVHSYAAIAIDRLLTMKEGGQSRFTVAELQPVLRPLLEALFAAFALPDSGENEYLMRCVMRVIAFVGPQIAPVAATCLQALAGQLLVVSRNPTQPGFNHYLFESVAALIRCSAAGNAAQVTRLEEMLFPAFQVILQEDVQEFHPYVFQIFAQLVSLRGKPLPEMYLALIFPPLLAPTFWERPGNVPALARLLRAFLEKAGPEIVARAHLEAVLGIFQKLNASRANDHEGFAILEAILEHVPMDSLRHLLPGVWRLLFQRLQAAKTAKYVRCFLVFMAHFVWHYGAPATAASADAVQPGIFLNAVLPQVWVPDMASVTGDDEERWLAAASTKVLCEYPELVNAGRAGLWGQLLDALLKLLEERAGGARGGTAAPAAGAGDEEEELREEAAAGYTAAFARLANAAQPPPQLPPELHDPRAYLATSLARFSQAQPGRVPSLVQAHVPVELQQRLQHYCQTTGVSIA